VTAASPTDAEALRAIAERFGIDQVIVDQAAAAGTLGLVVLERLAVPHDARFTQEDVARVSGLGEDSRRFWRALGFPDPDPDELAFTTEDLAMLQMVDAIISTELALRDSAMQLARVIGQSMQRIAQTQIEATEARLALTAPEEIDPAASVARAEALVPLMPSIFEYVWRRHLQSAIRRRLAADAPLLEGPPPRTVGFADMVGFTTLSQELDDAELAEVVDRFETQAQEIVASHGGRVVKMIGDEVMFEAAELDEAALIALELSDAFHRDEVVNDIRVGIAHGPVLAREGDLYGPTVNLAARLVGIAYAGSVITTGDVRAALGDDERFAFKSVRGRSLKHIGRVSLFALRRADDVDESPAARARRRRGVAARRVADRNRAERAERAEEGSAEEE
jgi:adenylate cyclase